ncbi:Flowering time control protein FPA [Heracleum sosnowskyi]|uniref:Flowering time control protein FPA n=1 Tax=Heracleum sosnowskyi TaxID=360622 RepID=A0AAD8M1I9_9APIA|nr:Flowering time control protein FPA [Heracleum sosnowskyi]
MNSSLWVGNLSGDVTEADLTNLFGKYGAIVKITLYSSKYFAFIHFKLPQDAKSAKDSLNSTLLRASPLKIDFAKPAKPCKSLWVGGISPSVTKEELEEQFRRFGNIQEFKFLRERNTAYVDYFVIDDATEALKNLNGLEVGGNMIRVDYLRSQASRKEQPDFRDARDTQFLNRSTGASNSSWIPQHALRNISEAYASTRPQHIQSPVGPKGDGQPSKVLWVSYPPSFPMDKQMLHNAMILFGEIEGITLFPSGNYSLVEFRSVEEAKLAKEGLEGRLFSDPRILILYSNSEAVPSNGQSSFYPEVKGPRTDVLSNDVQGYSQVVPSSIAGNVPPHGVSGPDISRRPSVPLGSLEPLQQWPDFSLTKHHKLQDSNTNLLVGVSNRKRLSPSPGVLSSPSQAFQPSIRPVSSTWDVYDASRSQRESKRSRVGGLSALSDPSSETMDDHYLGLNQFHGHGQQVGAIRGAAVTIPSMNRSSPFESRVSTGVTVQSHSEHDCIWRGVIAKGGQHVCRARCVPLEKEFEFEIPEVVNCSARTGLDMLAKHYGDAVGFNIIFFLPDSVEDFAPYTEFLRYLGAKNRAGVAKFDDGTTLFLVPPSDFLKNTLNIAGPERLYGVVLKFQSHVLGSTAEHTTSQQNYIDRPMLPSQIENKVMPQEERFMQTDYNRSVHENTFSKSVASSTNFIPGEGVPATSTSLSHAGVTLTPELIATLASLLPAKGNTLASQPLSGSSNPGPIQTPVATDRRHPHGWDYEQTKISEQSGHPINQAGYQYNTQGQFPLDHHYLLGQNAPSYAAQGVAANNQIEDATFNMRHGDVSTRQITNFVSHPHGGQYLVQPQTNRQCQVETSQETRHGYAQGIDASVTYSASPLLPITNSVTLSHQVSNFTASKNHIGNPMDGTKFGLDSQKQIRPLQSHPGAVQETLDEETDKNERYRSTLQFAANLLLQIQQNPGSEAGQGPGNN